MTELEIKQAKEIAELKKLLGLDVEDVIKENKKSYFFSKMTDSKLKECVDITKEFDKQKFQEWFCFQYKFNIEEGTFFNELINKYGDFLSDYNEESLKAHFVIPILNKIDFLSREYRYSGLYEEQLSYETDKFIFNGTTDFVVAKGLIKSEKPYFFIQEFKQDKGNSDPEYQLVAELIAAVELNNWTSIKGAYIKGTNWRFVILERLGENRYQYFVSKDFLSTNIEDLKNIFKNLLYIKNEIIDMIKREE